MQVQSLIASAIASLEPAGEGGGKGGGGGGGAINVQVNTGLEAPGNSVDRTLDPGIEVRGSKPAVGTGDVVGYHITNPIRMDARSSITKTL